MEDMGTVICLKNRGGQIDIHELKNSWKAIEAPQKILTADKVS